MVSVVSDSPPACGHQHRVRSGTLWDRVSLVHWEWGRGFVMSTSVSCVEQFNEVETSRLLLRRWRPSDVTPLAALNADPEVMRYFVSMPDRRVTEAMIAGWELKIERQGYGLWAVERRDDGAFLGMTGLNPVPPGIPGHGGMEVGWRLARHAWGHGYATEAARAALLVASRAGLAEVWSFTASLNTRSQAVMGRIGMVLAATFDHPDIEHGHPLRPHVLYRIGIANAKT